MPASQEKLSDAYHTTTKADDSVRFDGKITFIGLDLEVGVMPKGRFIWWVVEHPDNQGGVLRGMNVADYRTTTAAQLREDAIKVATNHLGDRVEATRQVDRIIAYGGMILPIKSFVLRSRPPELDCRI